MPNRLPTFEPTQQQDDRVEHLVVVRESDRYANVLMSGMVSQSLALLGGRDGVAEVAEDGLGPVTGNSRFTVTTLKRGRTSAALFEHKGLVYLYSMGSAASSDTASGDNGFIEILCEVITTYRPMNLWVANFSR